MNVSLDFCGLSAALNRSKVITTYPHLHDLYITCIVHAGISSCYVVMKEDLHQLVKQMYTAEKEPAFVPGRVLHIRKTGKKVHRRYVYTLHLYLALFIISISIKTFSHVNFLISAHTAIFQTQSKC